MLTISALNVIVVSICVSLAFSETWAELGFLCNKMHLCAEMLAKLLDDPLVLFELVVFVTISLLQKMNSFYQKGKHSETFSDNNG